MSFRIPLPRPRRFRAAYPGDCNSCLAEFDEGEEVGYVDDELVCEACCDEEDARITAEEEGQEDPVLWESCQPVDDGNEET